MLIKDLILRFKFIRSRFKTIRVRYLPSKCQQDEVFKKISSDKKISKIFIKMSKIGELSIDSVTLWSKTP